MKTISCIVFGFILGILGWFGFENDKPEVTSSVVVDKSSDNELMTMRKEKECELLKAQIKKNHEIIELKIKK